MSFTNSLFFVFGLAFYTLWKVFPKHRYALLSASSLIFYGAWNPYYVPLLMVSAWIAYFASHQIDHSYQKRNPLLARRWLIVGVVCDLAILCYFKYFNFFKNSCNDLSAIFGFSTHFSASDILLPVGISFYTFQSISHTVDVYRRQIKPCRSYFDFLLFDSLFPHLVAGPIQKASFLIPQVQKFETGELHATNQQVLEGWDLIFRGYIKKLLIADVLAPYANTVFNQLGMYRLPTIGVATFFFATQIYCDFSGYTDIARGLAKLLGFEFSLNFHYPYFSKSITEFWRRWHISLSSWLRDYLYIPLGGSRGSTLFTYRNLMITMILGGLWHGANYTFLLWGFYQGFLLILHKQWEKLKIYTPTILAYSGTFLLVLFGWFIFRINQIQDLQILINKMIHPFSGFNHRPTSLQMSMLFLFYFIHSAEYFLIKKRISITIQQSPLRLIWVTAILIGLYFWSPTQDQAFIYFQF